MTTKVSVILPTYNRSNSIIDAVTSVLNQSFRDVELIIVDDASTEDIKSIVDGIDDPRVRYIRRSVNGGAAAARNTGLENARGDYIAFQDSDDIWLPNKLHRQVALLEGLPPVVGAVTGLKILYGRDEQFNYGPDKLSIAPSPISCLTLEEDQVSHLLKENRVSVQNGLFKKDCLPTNAWFNTSARANEDWEFAVRLAQYTKIYEDPKPVVLGFVSKDGISQNFRKQSIGVIRIIKNNKEILHKYRFQYALLLLEVGRSLFKANRRKLGKRFLYAAVAKDPRIIVGLLHSLFRKLYASIPVRMYY